MIYILTGNVRTGKTSALLKWSENRKDVNGVLCPDNKDGKRYFLEINSQNQFLLEVDTISVANLEEIIQVGPFHFLKSAFSRANDYLIEASKNKEFKYLIIDELGKLELQNEGLHHAAKMLVKDFELNETFHLILVVRNSLIDTILNHYLIKNYQLIYKEELSKNRLA